MIAWYFVTKVLLVLNRIK